MDQNAFSFQEVTRIQMLVDRANMVVTSHARLLEQLRVKAHLLPVDFRQGAAFRNRLETTVGGLYELAKYHAARLSDPEDIEHHGELVNILETIVMLNGGLGHAKIRELATLSSREPRVIGYVKEKLERIMRSLTERYTLEGRNVMDIIRHVSAPPKECLFAS